MVAERPSYGDTNTEDVIRVKLVVVYDEVIMRLGTHEQVAPRIVAHGKSCMEEEMVAVDVGAAATTAERTIALSVEEQRLNTRPRHQVSMGLWGEPAGVNCVGVNQNGAVILEAVIQAFVVAESSFDVDATISLVQVLKRAAGIDSAFFCRRQESLRGGVVLGRPENVPSAGDIHLRFLSVGDASKQYESESELEPKKLSQPAPCERD